MNSCKVCLWPLISFCAFMAACTSSTQVRSFKDLYAPKAGALQQDQKADQLPVDDRSALVFFMRSWSLFTPNYSFFTENTNPENELGYCNGGEYIYFYVKPGRRKLIADSLVGSASIEMDLEANKAYFLQHGSIMGLLSDGGSLQSRDEAWGKGFLASASAGRIFKQEEDGVIVGEVIQEQRIQKEIQNQNLAEVGRVFSRAGNNVEVIFSAGMGSHASSRLVTRKFGKEFPLNITARFHTKVKAMVEPGSPAARGDKVYARLR